MYNTSGFKLVDVKTSISHMVSSTNSGVGQVGGSHTVGGQAGGAQAGNGQSQLQPIVDTLITLQVGQSGSFTRNIDPKYKRVDLTVRDDANKLSRGYERFIGLNTNQPFAGHFANVLT